MTLEGAAIALSGAGIVVTGGLALLFLADPVAAMKQTTHLPEKLPQVMMGRYAAFALLALGATLYRDLKVIAGLFAVFAFLGFVDAWIYAAGDHPFVKHVIAGCAAAIVVIVALMALRREQV